MTDLALNAYILPPGHGVLAFLDAAAALGARRVALTRESLAELPPPRLRRALADRDLTVSSLNSVGWFGDPAREAGAGDPAGRGLIEAAGELGAEVLCVIPGGMGEPADPAGARARLADGLAALDAAAAESGVALGLEPIHPASAHDKGCVATLAEARALVAPLAATGLLVDLFHSWWDPDLLAAAPEIRLLQICNVLPGEDGPRRSPTLDRGLLDLSATLGALRAAGWRGAPEFEIFDRHREGRDPGDLMAEAVRAYAARPA
ncbi:MAG TPA: sugar phosphate isomerase/epimerase [Paracoccaceae bacterium]|nr:sugar phosphate isomerase/epimerase [Paracoccaceae bacterium]